VMETFCGIDGSVVYHGSYEQLDRREPLVTEMVETLPKTRRIAGHEFDFNGRCVLPGCVRRLAEILSAQSEHVGKLGWAHQGALNAQELSEIEAERDRMWNAHLGSKSGG
jgi:hypothetical protein